MISLATGVSGVDEARVRLSVVIACLNAAGTIGDQLAALAQQDCPVPWEVLVCDNGSTDDTAAVIESAVRRWRDRLPLRVIDASTTRGAGPARNLGAERAGGAWLAFCDADDVVGEGWLTAMAEALGRHGFVGGRFDGTRLNSARALRSRPLDQQEGLQFSPEVLDLPHVGAGNMGIHRELFLRAEGFDPALACLEDTDLCWRVQLRHGVPLHFVPGAVAHVRLRADVRSMYGQGRNYGGAFAQLECRYGDRTPTERSGQEPSAVVETQGARGRLAILTAGLRGRITAGRLAWQLGWHRGYHGEKTRLGALRAAAQVQDSTRTAVRPPVVDPSDRSRSVVSGGEPVAECDD